MTGITGACSRLMGELLHALGGGGIPSTSAHIHPTNNPMPQPRDPLPSPPPPVDDLMLRALTAVFGMDQTNGRINKKKARQVVEKLGIGLVDQDEQHTTSFDLPPAAAAGGGGGLEDDEVLVEEVLGLGLGERVLREDESKRNELLRQAFSIFDEDGNGYIDALELKRVLQCLGLDNGWDMPQIEKMLKVVDLNMDGKVDFTEFELMMMMAA